MSKGQAGVAGFVIFMVFVVGFVLYTQYDYVETVRQSAIIDPRNTGHPLLMLVFYGLHPILWGGWLLLSVGAIIGVTRSGG